MIPGTHGLFYSELFLFVSQQLECELIRTLLVMKEAQLHVRKRKGREGGRKEMEGRGGANFMEINAAGAHAISLPSAWRFVLDLSGDLDSSSIREASLEQYNQTRDETYLPVPWRSLRDFTKRCKSRFCINGIRRLIGKDGKILFLTKLI